VEELKGLDELLTADQVASCCTFPDQRSAGVRSGVRAGVRARRVDGRGSEVATGIELIAAAANLGEFEAERGQLGERVVELVDAALDRLHLVETNLFVGVIRNELNIASHPALEAACELGHA